MKGQALHSRRLGLELGEHAAVVVLMLFVCLFLLVLLLSVEYLLFYGVVCKNANASRDSLTALVGAC